MFYVYILRSETHPNQTYIGSTRICGSAFPNTTRENRPHKQIQTLTPGGVCCVV